MKIFVLPPGEHWICDRFTNEWKQNHQSITTNDIMEADIVWLLADWCWNQIPQNILSVKNVCASVHHIVPEKFFGTSEEKEFQYRDRFVDFYHVPCQKTHDQIRQLTKKPIYVFPFWTNSNLFYHMNKKTARQELGLDQDRFYIGSFQRDTEGSDLTSPKLEKGPDIFVDTVMTFDNDPVILLGGWRRQYVISRLEKEGIEYKYIELPEVETINKMYNSLDLYIVGSRYEGGPQSIVECGLTKTDLMTTDVGLVPDLMPDNKSITHINNVSFIHSDIDDLYQRCIDISIEKDGFALFIEMFEKEL